MRLFETPGADAAYDRWLDPPDPHEEDGCALCHQNHREEGFFQDSCSACQDEKCSACKGSGWAPGLADGDPCLVCHNTGRIKP